MQKKTQIFYIKICNKKRREFFLHAQMLLRNYIVFMFSGISAVNFMRPVETILSVRCPV